MAMQYGYSSLIRLHLKTPLCLIDNNQQYTLYGISTSLGLEMRSQPSFFFVSEAITTWILYHNMKILGCLYVVGLEGARSLAYS